MSSPRTPRGIVLSAVAAAALAGAVAVPAAASTTGRPSTAPAAQQAAQPAAQQAAQPAAKPAPKPVAQPAAKPAAAPPAREGSPSSIVDRVADFYGAYIDAVVGVHPKLQHVLRADYLTKSFEKRLTAWEKRNHADGVLRAQDNPSHWAVSYHDSGAGHVFTTVTLTWGTGAHPLTTRLAVQSDSSTKLISNIEAAPAKW